MSTEYYYRTFLKQPFHNAIVALTGRGRRRKYHTRRGGYVNRFGATLSGEPNYKYLFGAPTGGNDGIIRPKVADKNTLGGRRRRRKRQYYRKKRFGKGIMENFLYPNTHFHTYPAIGTTMY